MDGKNCSSKVSRGSEAEANIAEEKATAENHGEDIKNRSEFNKYDDNCDRTVKI